MEISEQLARYRQLRTLADGSRVLMRPLGKDDKQGLVDLFQRASREELGYFRDDAADPAVVGSWVDHLDLSRVYPLVAIADERIVGDATLHFRERYHRHLAWVRIFLDRAYRRRGIGTVMLGCLVDIARRLGLQQIYVEVVTTQSQVIKALQDLGFQQDVILSDYFIAPSGELLDMAIMSLRLVDRSGEF